MAIWMAGIDHNRASLDVRSVFSFSKREMKNIYAFFKEQQEIEGCILVSTCNRMEIWLSVEEQMEVSPVKLLCNYLNVDVEEYQSYFIVRRQRDAIDHLFRVASGLESKIIGEDQIITQVGDALAMARSCYATDHTLEVLFRLAVTAGKRVKTEVDLSTADKSVIHTALRMLEEQGISVKGKVCMVIGNGMMGKLSAQTLMERGADVIVTIRQYHSGVVDVPIGCTQISYEKRLEKLPECDFVVSATSSPNYTLRWEELVPLSIDHPIYMIDLAVPRDIEQKVREFAWATLYDVDFFHIDLKSEKLKANLRKAERILEEKEREFYEWYEGRDLIPRIQRLKEIAGSDVTGRLTPVMKNVSLEEEQKQKLEEKIEGASSRMMNRLLFGMRAKLSDEVFQECLQAMEDVMGNI